MTENATIRKLKIERFRGIEVLEWRPAPDTNLILGGGDAGKTTILEAVALLLSPSNSLVLSEADYWQRKVDAEFLIQAVIELPLSSEIAQQRKFTWPWEWDGSNAVVPTISDGDLFDHDNETPVYCIQVRGTADLEVSWELIQPNDDVDHLSASVRRRIGVVRLTGDERNDRDLRLVYGSALDRLLADKGLRARIGQRVSEIDLGTSLDDRARKALAGLDEELRKEALPSNLDVGLTTSQGLSIGALIGLMGDTALGTSLPLSSWGTGTRRMASLKIAAATEAATSITVIDEIERGLEPYRLRRFIKSLQSRPAQSFITTHSAVAIGAADQASLWYLDGTGKVGALPHKKITRQQKRDPDTFLTKLAIIAEGPTEVGFVSYLLERGVDGDFADLGVRVCDGQGNPATLDLLEAMASGGLQFGGFVDNEGESTGRWSSLREKMGPRLFQWPSGCTEESIISLVDDDRLRDLVSHPDAGTEAERRITMAARLQIDAKSTEAIMAAASCRLRAVLIAAATGSKGGAPDGPAEKTWRGHGRRWFKSVDGGRELAEKMFNLGVWPCVKPDLMAFLNAIRGALGQDMIEDVHLG